MTDAERVARLESWADDVRGKLGAATGLRLPRLDEVAVAAPLDRVESWANRVVAELAPAVPGLLSPERLAESRREVGPELFERGAQVAVRANGVLSAGLRGPEWFLAHGDQGHADALGRAFAEWARVAGERLRQLGVDVPTLDEFAAEHGDLSAVESAESWLDVLTGALA